MIKAKVNSMKTVLKIVGILVLIFVAVGLLLDNSIDVKRQITINAAPQDIHPFVSDLEKWPLWTPWQEMDPTTKTVMGSVHEGVGASQTWTADSGPGELTIVESSPEKGITFDLIFDGSPVAFKSNIKYDWDGKATTVTWRMTGKMEPIIVGNYFAQLMDMFIGPSYEEGLQALKKLAEESA
jgi:uncharacterized membrane protein